MELIAQGALRVAKVVWQPRHDSFAFSVVCKATFELRPGVSPLAVEQLPVVEADVHTLEGGGLVLASEVVPLKKRPEVLVVGHAYAPEGRPVPSLAARLAVSGIDKTIRVVGDRLFEEDGRLDDPPEPFTRMPLVWERAAGGPGTSNPAGIPLGDAARARGSGRVPAPNLLPVGTRITSRSDLVPPIGFGPIAPLWPSRAECLQAHVAWWDPKRWHERPLPADLDLRYFNAAPADQQRSLPFGEEEILLEHLHPRFPQLSTRLAAVTPAATVDQGAGPEPLQLRCDTLVIDTDRGLAMLVWRGHVPLDHPQRAGRVVITGPGAPEAELPAWIHQVSEEDTTLKPAAVVSSSPVLPFSPGAATAAPGTAAIEVEPAARQPSHASAASSASPPVLETIAAPLVMSAGVLPFVPSSQGQGISRGETSSAESAAAHTFKPSPDREEEDEDEEAVVRTLAPPRMALPAAVLPFARAQDHQASPKPPVVSTPPMSASWGAGAGEAASPPAPALAWSPPVVAPPPSPSAVSELPVPPPLLGAIVSVPKERTETPVATASPAVEAGAPEEPAAVVEAEPEVALDDYPPARCGAIEARISCDKGKLDEVLRAEELDEARWKRVHKHWLGRIREEAARSRKKPMSDYDEAYVRELEAKRGALTLEEYARLAEAAERGAVAEALGARGLPEGSWPHIHRVWIGRMVKDVRVGKQVRGAIEAVRAG